MTTSARITGLRTYPVKSMDGSSLTTTEIAAKGLTGDRAWSVVDAEGQVVSARQSPALRAVQVALGPAGPVLDVPGVAVGVDGPAADAALSSYVGRPVRLTEVAGTVQEVAAVHLVSRQAVAAAIGTTSEDPACDIEAPRANLTVDFGDEPPVDLERAWVGQDIVIGDVVLRVNQVPKHCLGVYAEVVTPGRVNLGDAVQTRG